MLRWLPLMLLLQACPRPQAPACPDQEALGWSEASHTELLGPDYESLFSTDSVQRIDLEICPTDFRTMTHDIESLLQASGPPPGAPPAHKGMQDSGAEDRPPPASLSRDPVYVPATVRIGERAWPWVGLRFKGNSSLLHSAISGSRKLPLRLDLDEYEDDHPETEDQRLFGFKKLSLSPGFFDPSYLHEVLAGELLAEQDVPVARSAFFTLYVNYGQGPQYWGLYTLTEHVDDQPFLDRVFGDNDGNLYEPELGCSDWTCFDPESFPKQSNEEEADWSDIERAVLALHGDRSDAAAWRQELEAAFDVEAFLRWLAVNTAMGNGDSYGNAPHNYYLYGDPEAEGRLVWIPWDHNMAFLDGPFPLLPLTLSPEEVDESWPLIRFLMDDTVYAERYRGYLATLEGGLWDPARFEERALALHALIEPWVHIEVPPLTQLESQELFDESLSGEDGLVPWMVEREALVDEYLETMRR